MMLCSTAGSHAVYLDILDRMQYDIPIAQHKLPFVDKTDAISPPGTLKELAAFCHPGTASYCAEAGKGGSLVVQEHPVPKAASTDIATGSVDSTSIQIIDAAENDGTRTSSSAR